jgi:2-methylcitrate dehydratase PrpD
VHDGVGLDSFTEEAVRDGRVHTLAAKVRYEIDPNNPYPDIFTGHIRATLNDGRVVEERQPHFRGGAQEPLTREEIEQKFVRNAMHGGWDEARSVKALALLKTFFNKPVDLTALRG